MGDYCQAMWEHYSGMAMVDCTQLALKDSRFCERHQGFKTERQLAYDAGRAAGLREAIEEVKKAGEAEHARLERGWKRGDIVKMTSISIFNSILRRLRRRIVGHEAAKSKGEK